MSAVVADALPARERILRATLGLIGEQGTGAVSNRQVASAAGVSLGTLTYHFSDRDELLRESLRLFVGEEVARLTEVHERLRAMRVGGLTVAPDPELLRGLIRGALDGAAGDDATVAQFELYLHATRDGDLHEAVAECRAAYEALAREGLALLGVPEAEQLAPLIVATVEGTALRRLLTGEDPSELLLYALLGLVARAHGGARLGD